MTQHRSRLGIRKLIVVKKLMSLMTLKMLRIYKIVKASYRANSKKEIKTMLHLQFSLQSTFVRDEA